MLRRGWKTGLFIVSMLAVVTIVAEAAAWVGGRLAFGGRFSRPALDAHRASLVPRARGIGRPVWLRDEVLHPYVGFVPRAHLGGRLGVSEETPSVAARAEDDVVVAVVGGSVAHLFAQAGLPHLIERLRTLPRFHGKTLVPMNLAASGHKEPQQLMMVAYLVALGERLDILINLDGFNDVALYPNEDAPARVFPAYPRRWHQRVERSLSRDEFRAMVRRLDLEDRRRRHARAFSRAPWPALNTASLVYLVLDRRIEARLAGADRELLAVENAATAPSAATGPPVTFKDREELLRFLVDLWRRSSRGIHELATAGGVRYYHFLQPNQYVPRSKPIGRDEARTATTNEAYRHVVEAAFPMLRRAGRALTASGVRFHDLTDAFAGRPESLYVDACCHFNHAANLIVADRVFAAIAPDLR
jgi:hypothetical protein